MPRDSEHTILFLQSAKNPSTRRYQDFDSIDQCMEGICKTYENYLKVTNPNKSTITYDVNDLFDYIDSLPDLCVLLQTDNGRYAPWGKKWVKTKLFDCLRQQAGR
ncbi:enhancer of rudimentary homolog [Convolutriloba macropyga]|uniref:enhancer of rudimentary homolog n=1 Tax=Convolutriloba macropyga TaxID=536237 RepID=UPI003F51DD41